MARSYSQKDLKLLWGMSAARCAFPGCRQLCVAEATPLDDTQVLGEIAHIVAHEDGGPRADTDYPNYLRDKYDNLVLLCPTHHTLVDKQDSTYTVEDLREWKRKHELWVREVLSDEIPNVSFAELEILTKGLVNNSTPESTDLRVIDPTEKMEKNGLTSQVSFLLTLGLSKAHEVSTFLKDMAQVDYEFPLRLKAGFVNKYLSLKDGGLEGDSLFFALYEFATAGQSSFVYQAAALATMAHLFEVCDIFEK